MKLKRLDESDISLIAKQLVNISPWNKLNYQLNSLELYLKDDNDLLESYKIIDSENIVGVVCLKQPWWKGIYIEIFAIFPNFQKKGIGHKVIEWLQDKAIQENLHNIWLLVSEFNRPAYQFYMKNGFTEVGKLEGLLKEEYSELLLRKRINIGIPQDV